MYLDRGSVKNQAKNLLCAGIFLALCLIFPSAAKSAPGLEIMSAPVLESQPRQMLSAGIRVTNNGAEAEEYQITFNSPVGWQCSAFPEALEVEGDDSEVVFISINQPPGAPTGDYAIIVNCYPAGIPSDVASVEITVRIPGVLLLGIYPNRTEQPNAYSGDELGQTFTVTNIGNLSARIEIEVEASEDWPVTVIPGDRRLELEPDEAGSVVVSTTIPEELVQAERYRLTVTVRPEMEAGEEIPEWTVSTHTRVIPRQLSGGSNYATLDGSVEAQASWRDGDDLTTRFFVDMLQCEIAEGRCVSFGPFNLLISGNDATSFGQSQSMTAKYDDRERGYVHAGDFSLDLASPLMGQYRSGRGGDVLYRSGDTGYRVFYSHGRGSIPTDNFGLQVTHQMGTEFYVRATALRNSERELPAGIDREAESSTNLGLLVGYAPSESVEVTGEAGWTDASESGSDTAWRINGRYKRDGFSSNCEWLRAGGGFRGGWRNTEVMRLYLSWSPIEDLNLWANYYNRTRPDLSDEADTRAQNSRTRSIGASWNARDIGQFRVSHNIEHSSNPVLNDTDIRRTTTEYSYSRDWGDFGFSASWRDRIEEDRITLESDSDRLLRLTLSARLSRTASLALGYSAGWTGDNAGEGTERESSIRLGGDFSFGGDLDASFNVEMNTAGSRDDRISASGRLAWTMSNGSRLNFDLRTFSGSGNSYTEAAIGYTYPLSVPLTWLPRKGSMEGRVFYADDADQGMPNVRVSVGNVEVVTDENGHFNFPSLDPGEYQLTVDTSSLGVGMTPDVELPMIFYIDAGSATLLEIPVRQSVVIGGQVLIQVPGSPGVAPSQQPLPDMVIEIQYEGESTYRVTDSFGRFLFTDLQPGSYIVLLRSERLPQWHQVMEPVSISLDLAPGDSRRDLVFVVGPMERQVEITTEAPGS